MAEVGYRPELGYCKKCGMMKIQANDVVSCIVCDAPKGTSTLVNKTADPGESVFERDPARLMEKKIGGKPQGGLVTSTVGPTQTISGSFVAPQQLELHKEFRGTLPATPDLKTAIAILTALPMPKDIKQFKAINKAIKILEGLTNE